MSDKKNSPQKPVTLEDYISEEPVVSPEAKRAARASLSADDRARLEALERAVRETEPEAVRTSKTKRSRSSSRANQRRQGHPKKKGKLVFWLIVILLIVGFASLD